MKIDKLIPKFIRKCKRPRKVQILSKKNKAGKRIVLDIKTYGKATVIRYGTSPRTDKSTSRTEQNPEVDPHVNAHSTCNKVTQQGRGKAWPFQSVVPEQQAICTISCGHSPLPHTTH